MINERIAKGQKINNLTIGDFDPKYFPILKNSKMKLKKHMTNIKTNGSPKRFEMNLENCSEFLIKTQTIITLMKFFITRRRPQKIIFGGIQHNS